MTGVSMSVTLALYTLGKGTPELALSSVVVGTVLAMGTRQRVRTLASESTNNF